MEKIAKPLILEIEEAKQETSTAVNEIMKKHNLPCYLYQSIIEDIYRQVTSGARNEINSVYNDYNSRLQKNKEKDDSDNKEGKQQAN